MNKDFYTGNVSNTAFSEIIKNASNVRKIDNLSGMPCLQLFCGSRKENSSIETSLASKLHCSIEDNKYYKIQIDMNTSFILSFSKNEIAIFLTYISR